MSHWATNRRTHPGSDGSPNHTVSLRPDSNTLAAGQEFVRLQRKIAYFGRRHGHHYDPEVMRALRKFCWICQQPALYWSGEHFFCGAHRAEAVKETVRGKMKR
jgi:hypothetical protein